MILTCMDCVDIIILSHDTPPFSGAYICGVLMRGQGEHDPIPLRGVYIIVASYCRIIFHFFSLLVCSTVCYVSRKKIKFFFGWPGLATKKKKTFFDAQKIPLKMWALSSRETLVAGPLKKNFIFWRLP